MFTTRILTRMIIHFKISRTNFTLILREKIFRWFFLELCTHLLCAEFKNKLYKKHSHQVGPVHYLVGPVR